MSNFQMHCSDSFHEHFQFYCFRWTTEDATHDKSILVQVMDWCYSAPSHYCSIGWHLYTCAFITAYFFQIFTRFFFLFWNCSFFFESCSTIVVVSCGLSKARRWTNDDLELWWHNSPTSLDHNIMFITSDPGLWPPVFIILIDIWCVLS